MKNRKLLTIISFVLGLAVTACDGANSKSSGLELLYFGRKIVDQQQTNIRNKARYLETATNEAQERDIVSLNYGENFEIEARVKNEKRLSFVDIVISSASTNHKYVFNEGNGQYQCQATTVFRDEMWITDITIPIDFSLIKKDISEYKCGTFETYLEVEEITFFNMSGVDAKADIRSDVKKLSIESEGKERSHDWALVKTNNEDTIVRCSSCQKEKYVASIDEENGVVSYGLYPQTVVDDEELIGELNSLEAPYIDDWYYYRGSFYAKLSEIPAQSSTTNRVFNNGKAILGGETYWFECKSITWEILSKDNGQYFLLSTVLLDAHSFNEYYERTNFQGYYANNYENSEIRKWLNDDFYNSAFALGDSYVQTTIVDNGAETTNTSGNQYACENTRDKVFMLSYQDCINLNLNHDYIDNKTTDWARARGIDYSSPRYWTRSPVSANSTVTYDIDANGRPYGSYVNYASGGVRPAITFKINQ